MLRDVREIETRRISPNLRAVYTLECIEETARSIRCFGQLEPVLIWFEYESFRILDGEKRWRACRKLGMKTIKAVIVEAAIAD
jgi:ParB family transcriptional regulator, chromosome partitioning protein